MTAVTPHRLLIVDPDADRGEAIASVLSGIGFAARSVGAPPEDGEIEADAVLLALESFTASRVATLKSRDPLVPILVHSPRRLDAVLAADLGRAGIRDVLVVREPHRIEALAGRLASAVERRKRRTRVAPVADELIGSSAKIAQVKHYIQMAARSEANVLILGESGTGKELVARAIHRHGARREGPFVAVNVSAIPETLLESEMFGHERGSFTGAAARTRGLFEQAHGGTLFFDEMGEMPVALQAKLLRVLQPPSGQPETSREFTRVGGDGSMSADVRLVFATHRDLPREVSEKRFREDLYQRIAVLAVHVPPLRERREDIRVLAETFLGRHAELEGKGDLSFDATVMDVLEHYDFPLNVRELEALVRSLVVVKDVGEVIVLGDLPPRLFALTEAGGGDGSGTASERMTLAEVEAAHVLRVMKLAGGNKSRAARMLGISRPALDRKLEATPT